MSNLEIQVLNADDVAKLMATRGDRVKKSIDTILKKAIFVVERYAKMYSPVLTGRMRSSIGEGAVPFDGKFHIGEPSVEYGEGFATIQPTVTYAKYVNKRVPFMFAAKTEAEPQIKDLAEAEINKALA